MELSRELRNENIDIVNYTNNNTLFIQRALTPAKVSTIELDLDNMRASVFLKPDQVSLGNRQRVVRILNWQVSSPGFEIDVYRDSDEPDLEDVDLDEFSDEIESWIIDAFKGIGCDTARSVLALNREELIRRTDLEEETIDDVLKVLASEFDE